MNRHTRFPFVLFLVAVTLAPPVAASRGAARQALAQAQPQAVFRSGVELARLDVRAVDDNGRAVKDLRPEEVQVFESGQLRPLRLFQHVAEPEGSYLEVARRTIGGEVSTNQGSPRGHLYVIVFDQYHITAGNEQRARLAAERFLTTRVRAGDRVALYGLPGPGPNIPFSSNARAVAAELASVRGSLDRTAMSSAGVMTTYEAFQVVRGDTTVRDRIIARATENAGALDVLLNRPGQAARAPANTESTQTLNQVVLDSARTVVDGADADTRAFLRNLADVIRELAAIEGRKSIILISEGFYADNVRHEIELVATASARASAAIYSLDINRREINLRAEQPAGGAQYAEIQNRLESLGTLAADTDGELLPDAGSRVDVILNRIADTLQDYYVLGFEPDPKELADRDRYRRVTVKVLRKGVTIRARTGFALNDPAATADKRRSIDTVLAAPFPQAGVPIEMTTYVLRGASRGIHRVIVSAEAQLPLQSASAMTADVVFVVKDARDGRLTASGTDKMRLPSAALPGRTTGVGHFSVQFEAPPGNYLMRLAVREPAGTVGSVDRRFEVRPLDGVDVSASDLVLGRRTGGLPVRAMARTDEVLGGVLEIYAWRPADLDRIEVMVDLARIGEVAAETSTRATLLDVQPAASGARRGAQVELPLQGIAPGQYVVRATVKAGGETVTELSRELQVVPATTRVEPDAPAPAERVPPTEILSGEIGRRLVAALAASTTDRTVVTAAGAASTGNWQKVEEGLRKAVPSPTITLLQGLASFAVERYEEAATKIDSVLNAAPLADTRTTAMVSFVLGWIHTYRERDLDAITAWRSAIVADATLVPAYLALADAYVKRFEPALALQVLHGGLAAVPRSAEIAKKLRDIEGKQSW
ncbi:MAG: VWA domain-containing protein [Bacteroidales bacterium]